MNLKRSHFTYTFVTLTMGAVLCMGTPARAELYSLTDLGALVGRDQSGGSGINNAGQVVGSSFDSEGDHNGAFLYRNGTMTDLGNLDGLGAFDRRFITFATGINDARQVVGFSRTQSGEFHAFLYHNGIMTDLGTLGGSSSDANGINKYGHVVGSSTTQSGETHVFLYRNGTMTDLGSMGGFYSNATGINNAGQVVGAVVTFPAGNPGPEFVNAFLYSHGSITNLGNLGGLGPLGETLPSTTVVNLKTCRSNVPDFILHLLLD